MVETKPLDRKIGEPMNRRQSMERTDIAKALSSSGVRVGIRRAFSIPTQSLLFAFDRNRARASRLMFIPGAGHDASELMRLEGLDQMLVEAGFQNGLTVFRSAVAGQRD